MKRFLVLLFLLLALGIFVYRQNVTQLLSYNSCDTPIPYKIGSVDPRFGLTDSQVLADTKTATNILNNAEGKQLFAYSNTARLTVNFVYDQRAMLSTQIGKLQNHLNQTGNTLKQQATDYETQVREFQKKLANFNALVEKYNQQGGVSPDVYKNLIDQQKQLQAEANSLNQKAQQLNLSSNNYNVGVSNLNQDASQFNAEIAKKPEEGLYSPSNNTITIYFAENYNELIHTLAHEFGHALGLQHVSNPQAIMYPYSTTSLTFTSDEMAQMTYVCRTQPAPLYWIKIINQWIANKMILHGLRSASPVVSSSITSLTR